MQDARTLPLHALRTLIGDETFFVGVREWLKRYDDSSATTEDFIEVYEDVSGHNLDGFFDVWLRQPAKPSS